ncbi:MAG TPA: hypothetical protein VM287_00250 [Egibacteraceae bacterium]|nr:hypothetical protein [Egibacteraceae bacterium]
MAHPQLTRRGDRRAALAVGAAAALLLSPAANATPLGVALDCGTDAVAAPALRGQCQEAGMLSGLGIVPEAVQSAVDPIEKVVDDVLKKAPALVQDPVGQVPAVVEDVVESLPPAPVPAPAEQLLPDIAPEPPPADAGAAGPAETTVRRSGPPQGPGIALPPFIRRGVPANATVTRPRPQPFTAPAMTGPFFGDMTRLADDFVSSHSPIRSGIDALGDIGGSRTTTGPGPDAPSWLLATASGMLLLLGAAHLLHARQRHSVTVAR